MDAPTDPLPEEPAATPEGGGMTIDELLNLITPRVWVTPALGVLIAIGFGAELALGVSPTSPTAAQLLKAGGEFGPYFADGQWWRAFTSMFLHAGLLHLAFNLWAFWSVGHLTERVFGNRAFLALYLLSGIGGSLASLAWSPLVVGVGASGAIFGVYGALLAFVLLHRGVFPAEYLARQRNSIIGFIGYNIVFGLSQKNTDMAAHAGGLVTGMLAGAVLGRDVLQPAAHSVRRVCGAVGLAVLLVVAAFAVRARLLNVPEIKASRAADAALVHLQAKEYAQAIERYTEALTHERDKAWLFNRGLAYFGTNDLKRARQDVLDAHVLEPTVTTSTLLCDVGVTLGGAPEALEDTAKYCTAALALEEDPKRKAGILSNRAIVRGTQKRAADSLADAETALTLDAHAAVARARRAALNLEASKLVEAEQDCQQLASEADATAFAFLVCARVAHARKDPAAERARIERGLVLAPNDVEAVFERAALNAREGRLVESVADYTTVLAGVATFAAAWNNRAWTEVELGDAAHARTDAERAVALEPSSANYHGTLCFALAAQGELEAARAACAKAIALGSESGFDAGMVAFLAQRPEEARRIWQSVSDADPVSARELRPWMAKLPRRSP